jgi:hypothetical protein
MIADGWAHVICLRATREQIELRIGISGDQRWRGVWWAINVKDAGSPDVGIGRTVEEAIEDLVDQITRHWRPIEPAVLEELFQDAERRQRRVH